MKLGSMIISSFIFLASVQCTAIQPIQKNGKHITASYTTEKKIITVTKNIVNYQKTGSVLFENKFVENISLKDWFLLSLAESRIIRYQKGTKK